MFEKLEKMDLLQRMTKLRLKAAVRFNITPETCHVGHLVLEAFYEKPGFIHQIDAATDERQTNLEVVTQSTQLASALRNYGLSPGDHVVVMGENHLKIALPFYACYFNGYGICPMDPSIVQKDIVSLFTYVQPKMVFCPKSKEEEIQFAISSNDLKCGVVAFDGTYNTDSFIKKYNGTEKGFCPAVFNQTKLNALLMLTSGTTGLPKVAMVTFDALMNTIYTFWASMSFKIRIVFAMATIQWLSTIMSVTSTPLSLSTRLQTSKLITPKHLREIINKYKPDSTVFTPHILRQFLQEEGGACDMSCLLIVLIGGSVVQKKLLDQLQAKVGGFVQNAYSMTELLVPIFRYIPGMVPEGSIGLPMLEKFQYRLIGNDGNDIEKPHQVGELWLKGGSFFNGYLNNPEETAKMITPDGWLKTGDLFSRDENNFYFFKERRRVLIKYKSRFVAPMEIEDVVRKHPGVAEACVVGLAHPDFVELPVAAITRRNGNVIKPEEIFCMINEELPELKQLHGGLFFVDSLPMTASGKINRSKVLELALKAERILPKIK